MVEGHLLSDEKFAEFVVGDVDLWFGQDRGVGGSAQELD